jgi:hypothetical protein
MCDVRCARRLATSHYGEERGAPRASRLAWLGLGLGLGLGSGLELELELENSRGGGAGVWVWGGRLQHCSSNYCGNCPKGAPGPSCRTGTPPGAGLHPRPAARTPCVVCCCCGLHLVASSST